MNLDKSPRRLFNPPDEPIIRSEVPKKVKWTQMPIIEEPTNRIHAINLYRRVLCSNVPHAQIGQKSRDPELQTKKHSNKPGRHSSNLWPKKVPNSLTHTAPIRTTLTSMAVLISLEGRQNSPYIIDSGHASQVSSRRHSNAENIRIKIEDLYTRYPRYSRFSLFLTVMGNAVTTLRTSCPHLSKIC